jgi:hypothetical protein
MVKRELSKYPEFDFEVIISDNNPKLSKKYNIKKAPTLVLTTGEKLQGISEIKKYLEGIKNDK